jgi:hypothetical protein
MHLEKLLKKLKEVRSCTKKEKENVRHNIKICEMQIKIRDKNLKKII